MIASGGLTSRWAAISILTIGSLVFGLLIIAEILRLYQFETINKKARDDSRNISNQSMQNVKAPKENPKPQADVKQQANTKNSLENYSSLSTPPARSIGIYISNSPDDPAAIGVLNWVKSAGFDTVYNYSVIDGTPEQISWYLDQANSRGIKVIISLKDLYDELPGGSTVAARHSSFGVTNEQIAQNIATRFGTHPGVWGFAITDEAPMDLSEVGKWRPILEKRYRNIKNASNKPVMVVLVGKTSPYPTDRHNFLSSLKSSTDSFALDYYPVPYQDSEFIRQIGNDLISVGDPNGWFVTQTFSWSRYPDTARSLGFNLGAARPPNANEIIGMSKLALSGGAKNILFYSYFDIAGDPAQLANVAAAVRALR